VYSPHQAFDLDTSMSTEKLFSGTNIFDFKWMMWAGSTRGEYGSLSPMLKCFISAPPSVKEYPITKFKEIPISPLYKG
jgi:hypothetical protein